MSLNGQCYHDMLQGFMKSTLANQFDYFCQWPDVPQGRVGIHSAPYLDLLGILACWAFPLWPSDLRMPLTLTLQ